MEKIIYIANQRMPTEKAYGLQIAKMCEAFADSDMKVTLMTPLRHGLIVKSVYDFYGTKRNFFVQKIFAPDFYLPGKLDRIAFALKNLISAVRVAWAARRIQADVIYSRDELPLYFLSFLQKNLVFEAHKFSPSRMKQFCYRRFLKCNMKTVVISGGLQQKFLDFGFKREQLVVAHDGVDLEKFFVKEDKKACREQLGLSLKKKIVGYVGQLTTMGMDKGIDTLIKAAKLIKNEHRDIQLVMVGGSDVDITRYRDFAYKHGLDEKSALFLGRKEHSLIPMYLAAFDVLAMPFPFNEHYAFYMSPLKLFEYMASGRPIIASDLPSVREVLHEKNALFHRPGNFQSLASALGKILKNPEAGESIALQSRTDIQDYSWQKRAQKILEFIKK